jgi:PAS domain S-box-containing protein
MSEPKAGDPFRSGRVLRVLIVEADAADAELAVSVLKRAGYPLAFDVIDSATDFEERLAHADYDAILCDHNLGAWTGMHALEILKRSGKDIPFLVLSGVLGDEGAIEYVKQGATDYLLKHRLGRLPAALWRSLREKTQREEAARLQEQIACAKMDWELTFDSIPDPVMLVSEECVIQRANRALALLVGLEFSQIIGKHCYEVVHTSDEPPQGCPHQCLLKTGKEARAEIEEPWLGKIFDYTASPLRDSSGALMGSVIVLRDVTERRRMEEALRQSEQFNREVIASAREGIIVFDQEFRYQVWNRFMEELTGMPASQVLGKQGFDLFPHLREQKVEALLQRALEGEVVRPPDMAFRVPLTGKSGWVSAVYSPHFGPNGEIIGVISIVRDMTERKRAEEALIEERHLLHTLMDNLPDHIYFKDRDSRFNQINIATARLFGLSDPSQAVGKTDFDFFTDEHAQQAYSDEQELIRTGQPVLAKEEKETWPDGHETWVSTTKMPLRDAQGRIIGTFGISRDITEHKRAEEALRESEERLRSFIANVPLGVYRTTPDGRVLMANPALLRMLGYDSLQELASRNLERETIESGYPRSAFREQIEREGEARDFEAAWKRRDGSVVFVRESARAIRADDGRVLYYDGILEDVTERRRLEEQLRQAQKMEAVGRLAAGVAHDFNNLLTIVIGYSDLVLQKLTAGDRMRPTMEEIKSAGERAAWLTRQLLAFSRKQVLQPQILDLSSLLTSADQMLRRMIGEDIELVTHLPPVLGHVKADRGQIEQVIMNLAVNARDAMPQGGKLTLEAANVELDSSYARSHEGVVPGPYVTIAMSDTGTGMDAETRAHIFEPFFTTKEPGKGTGLGLSTVYGIIKQSGGNIWVYSEPGKGTTFKVYLPRIDQAVKAIAPGELRVEELLPGSETILLVEDEEAVRSLAREALEFRGYHVLETKGAIEALQVGERHKEHIHLLLTDVVMPQMGGRELAEHFAPLHPETKVLYMSGYADNAVVHHGLLDPGTALLDKPFTAESLARKLREVLDRAGGQKT